MNTVVTITTVIHILFGVMFPIHLRQKVGEYHNIYYLILQSLPSTFNKKWASNVVISSLFPVPPPPSFRHECFLYESLFMQQLGIQDYAQTNGNMVVKSKVSILNKCILKVEGAVVLVA